MSSSGLQVPEETEYSSARQGSSAALPRTPHKPETPNAGFSRVFTPRSKSNGKVAQEQKETREMQSNPPTSISRPQSSSSSELPESMMQRTSSGGMKALSINSLVSTGPRVVDGNQQYNRAVVDHYDALQTSIHNSDSLSDSKNMSGSTGGGVGVMDGKKSLLDVDLAQQPVPPQSSFFVRYLLFLQRCSETLEHDFQSMVVSRFNINQHELMCLYRSSSWSKEEKARVLRQFDRNDSIGAAWLREDLSITESALLEHESSAKVEEDTRRQDDEDLELKSYEECLQAIGDLVRRYIQSRVPPHRLREIWNQSALSEIVSLTTRVVDKCANTASLPQQGHILGGVLEKQPSAIPPISLKLIYGLCLEKLHTFELQCSLHHSKGRNMLQNSKTPTVTAMMMSPKEQTSQHLAKSVHASALSALADADNFYQDTNNAYKESAYKDPVVRTHISQKGGRMMQRRASLTGFQPEVVVTDYSHVSPNARLLHKLHIPYYSSGSSSELYYITMGGITPVYITLQDSARIRSSGWTRLDAQMRLVSGGVYPSKPVQLQGGLVRPDGCLDSDEDSDEDGGVGIDGAVKPIECWNEYLDYKQSTEKCKKQISRAIPSGFTRQALQRVLQPTGKVPAVVSTGWTSWEQDDLDTNMSMLNTIARTVPVTSEGMLEQPTSQWEGDPKLRHVKIPAESISFTKDAFLTKVRSWMSPSNAQQYVLSCYMHLVNERVHVARMLVSEFLNSGFQLLFSSVFNHVQTAPMHSKTVVQYSFHLPNAGPTTDPHKVSAILLQTVKKHAALFCGMLLPIFNKQFSIEPTIYTENILRRSYGGIHKGVHWSQLRLLVKELDLLHTLYSCFDICALPKALRVSGSSLRCVSLSTVDPRFILAGNADGILQIWNLDTRTCLSQYCPQRSMASTTEQGQTYSRATTTYVSTDGQTATYQALVTQGPASTYHSVISACSFHDYDGTVISADMSGVVRVWNTKSGGYTELTEHTDGILSMSYASKHVVTGSMDGSARQWSLQTNTCTTVLGPLDGWCTAVAFSKCERYLTTCSASGQMLVWTISKARTQLSVKGTPVPIYLHTDYVHTLIPWNDALMISLDKKGKLQLWDAQTKKAVTVFTVASASLPITACVREDWLAVACLDRSISIFQISTGTLLRCVKCNMDVPTSMHWKGPHNQIVGTDTGRLVNINL